MSFWRISPRQMSEQDLHDRHESRLWVDSGDESDTRRGLSCCDSLEGLVSYFTGRRGEHGPGRGAALDGCWLVELDGERTSDAPWEAEYERSEALIHPSRIVSQEPVTERFIALLTESVQRDYCDHDERARYDAEHDCVVIDCRCGSCDGTGTAEYDDSPEECDSCDGTGWIAGRPV